MQDDDIEMGDNGAAELDALLRETTRLICGTRDYAAGLARFMEILPTLAPQLAFATEENGPDSKRALCGVLFREIWNHVPRPDHGFRPLPMPKQERNSPCQCGSGKKYKQCCARYTTASPFGGLSLLRYVLEDLPQSDFEKLPFRQMSAEELAFVADQWLNEGHPDKVTFLLVPLLADLPRLDARHEAAFDLLGDAYLSLGLPDAREALVERMMKASDPTLQSAALQRRCTVLSDAGRWAEAWQVFAQAQRVQPDNPGLSHLEVIMLAAEGRTERAKERAKFWLARLSRLNLAEPNDRLLDFLRLMSEDPDAALAMTRGEFDDDDDLVESGNEWVLALLELWQTLPEPECHYALGPRDGNAGGLETDHALRTLETEWAAVFPPDEEDSEDRADFSPWHDTAWLDWLAAHPLAWQSFRVLEDVIEVIEHGAVFDEDLEDDLGAMQDRVLDHAARLLELVISHNRAEGCRLEWVWPQNRPPLHLLAEHIVRLDDANESLRLTQWLVTTLNPNDEQELRENLALRLLASERAADALALCERYPDEELGAMLYARVLALHDVGRFGDAALALARARHERPKILATLLAKRPPEPDLDFDRVEPGGDDEAWFYRMDWLSLWQESGALDWLRTAAKGVK